ncbi:MAG: DUF6285 domain-containing protein [Proteobacteria bacterium]|nr:DUF6285 domain-containing protein [Pseudomonadota bacterium]MDA1021910.1 DUF6285 domain-containing protein [Pseudomonadota bacterium]
MRDHPTGKELLDLVRRIEDGDASILLPDDERYRDLMMASARAIAERQQDLDAGGDGPEKKELENLSGLLDEEGSLAGLNQMLAEKIRLGDFDASAPGRDAAARHLWETALERVRESNPKALGALD